MTKKKISAKSFQEMKENNEKIVMLTAYDYPSAKIIEKLDVEGVLVGDSLGNIILGYENTLPVTLEDILHHTKAVARGLEKSMIISDMPFNSYQSSTEEAVKNACRLVKEGNAEAVKIEGGKESLESIKRITDIGIPVMGHLGLTPQKILRYGGYQVRGKTGKQAKKIFEEAKMLEEAGVFSLVLEAIPWEIGRTITKNLEIPTIGIGAGPHCDGQILVLHDILGLSSFSPNFAKKYVDLNSMAEEAIEEFSEEVKKNEFPNAEHSYSMEKEEFEEFKKLIEE